MKKLVLILFLFCCISSCHTYEYRLRKFNLSLDKAFDTLKTLESGDTIIIGDTVIIIK